MILSGVILTDSYNFSSFSLFLVTRSYSVVKRWMTSDASRFGKITLSH